MPERRKNATYKTDVTDANHPLPQSHPSNEGFIPPHGGYEKLSSYPPDKQQKAMQTVLEHAKLLCGEWAG